MTWGICRAISGDVSVSVIVSEQFPKISGSLISFSTDDKLYEYAQVPFTTKFQNTGGVALKPVGNIVIKNQFAKTVAIIPVNNYGLKVAPGATQDYFNQWARSDTWGLGLGWYSANLALNYGTDETFNANVKFLIFPWRVVWFTLIYLLIVFIINNIFWQTQLPTSGLAVRHRRI
ncbi:MAG: hypothetical protein M1338_01140 [Patescibacteria group bacterium]|nr:hypothetical protein [Patescibacteria group bacterium]